MSKKCVFTLVETCCIVKESVKKQLIFLRIHSKFLSERLTILTTNCNFRMHSICFHKNIRYAVKKSSIFWTCSKLLPNNPGYIDARIFLSGKITICLNNVIRLLRHEGKICGNLLQSLKEFFKSQQLFLQKIYKFVEINKVLQQKQ